MERPSCEKGLEATTWIWNLQAIVYRLRWCSGHISVANVCVEKYLRADFHADQPNNLIKSQFLLAKYHVRNFWFLKINCGVIHTPFYLWELPITLKNSS